MQPTRDTNRKTSKYFGSLLAFGDGNFDLNAFFKAYIITVFVSLRIFNANIPAPSVRDIDTNYAFPGWLPRGDRTILSTVPVTEVLGCSEILVVSRLSPAIFADLAIRGFASSFVMLASNALPGFFLVSLRSIHPP